MMLISTGDYIILFFSIMISLLLFFSLFFVFFFLPVFLIFCFYDYFFFFAFTIFFSSLFIFSLVTVFCLEKLQHFQINFQCNNLWIGYNHHSEKEYLLVGRNILYDEVTGLREVWQDGDPTLHPNYPFLLRWPKIEVNQTKPKKDRERIREKRKSKNNTNEWG